MQITNTFTNSLARDFLLDFIDSGIELLFVEEFLNEDRDEKVDDATVRAVRDRAEKLLQGVTEWLK